MNAFPVPPPLLVIVSVAIERWHPHDESTRFRRWMKRVSGKRYSTHCPHVIAAGAPSNENVLEKQVGEIAAFHVRTRCYSPSLVAVIFQQILSAEQRRCFCRNTASCDALQGLWDDGKALRCPPDRLRVLARNFWPDWLSLHKNSALVGGQKKLLS